ncbi:MAG: collagen binding domain-containing protein, partial [Wujia sp.]
QILDNRFEIDKQYISLNGFVTEEALYNSLRTATEFTITKVGETAGRTLEYDEVAKIFYIKNIYPGTYIVSETEKPADYAALSDITITVNENGEITIDGYTGEASDVVYTSEADATKRMTAYNRHRDLCIEIIKVDDEDLSLTPMADATFNITDSNGNEIVSDFTTDSQAYVISLDSFRANEEYTLNEVKAPYGYEVNSQGISFMLDSERNLFIKGENGYVQQNDKKLVMADKKQYIGISKVEMANSEELPGAKLVITDSEGNKKYEWTSTNDRYEIPVKELEYDKEYTLTEITAPYGYELAENIIFKVDRDGKVYVKIKEEFKAVDDNTVVMEDDYKYLYITKVDITNGKELPGAKLTITDKNGNVIAQWTSNEESYRIPVLSFNYDEEYTLTEVTAPDGYEVAESIVFKFDKENNFYIRNSSNVFTKVDKTSMTMQDSPIQITTTKPDEAPNTGDRSPIKYILLVIIISLVALERMFFLRRRVD